MKNDFYFSMDKFLNFKNNTELPQYTKEQNDNNISKVAKQIEGLFVHMMIKSMKNSFPKDNLIQRNQENLYQDIYDQFIAQKISEKGIGLAKMIEKQINLSNTMNNQIFQPENA